MYAVLIRIESNKAMLTRPSVREQDGGHRGTPAQHGQKCRQHHRPRQRAHSGAGNPRGTDAPERKILYPGEEPAGTRELKPEDPAKRYTLAEAEQPKIRKRVGTTLIFYTMKKFTIIEEGRLDYLEMSRTKGGNAANPDCYQKTYRTIENCPGYAVYAMCPTYYYSCNTNGVVSCSAARGGHRGAPGGAGLRSDIILF